jgi:biotin carboxyl carrier protein
MSRLFTVTVNGTTYEVEVEEVGGSLAPVAPVAAPVAPVAPVAAPVAAAPAAPKAAPAAPKATGAAGSVKVTAPMPGKILDVKTSVGASVKKGDVVAILEAMKMENEIVAPQDGTIASIETSKGASVETGAVLVTMN